MLQDPEATRATSRSSRHEARGDEGASAPRDVVWQVLNDPEQMAELMPGVEGFEVKDDRNWQCEGEDPARARRPAHDGRLREARGAGARVRGAEGEGQRRRRDHEHADAVPPERGRRGDLDALGGRRQDRGPGRVDGAARAPADRQPAGRQRAHGAGEAGLGRRRRVRRRRRAERRRGGPVPHRRHAADDGAARRDARVGAGDGRGGYGHDLARRGVSRGGASTGWRRAPRPSSRP